MLIDLVSVLTGTLARHLNDQFSKRLSETPEIEVCRFLIPVLLSASVNVAFVSQVRLEFTSDALKEVAHLAMERRTGARGLRAIVVSDKCRLFISLSVHYTSLAYILALFELYAGN
jgi:hypothetical protein